MFCGRRMSSRQVCAFLTFIMKNTTSIKRFHNGMAFFIDHTEIGGASGSPMVDSQGFAAGMHFSGVENSVIAVGLAQLEKT